VVVFAGFPPNAPLLLSLGMEQTEQPADALGRVEIRLPGAGATTVTVRH
jgi:hypothetical protein